MISFLTDAPRSRAKVDESEPTREEGSTLDVRMLAPQASDQMVQLFKLLADETRLQILYFLTQRDELNVGTLCELLAQSQPAVSHHLALMRGAGFLQMRREGKHNFYRLQPAKFAELGEVVYAVLPAQARAWPSTRVTLANSGSMAAGASVPGTLASSGG